MTSGLPNELLVETLRFLSLYRSRNLLVVCRLYSKAAKTRIDDQLTPIIDHINRLEKEQTEVNNNLDHHSRQLKLNFNSWIGIREEYRSTYMSLNSWWRSPYNFFWPDQWYQKQFDVTEIYMPIINEAKTNFFSQRLTYDELLCKKIQREDRLSAYKNFVQQGQWDYSKKEKQDHLVVKSKFRKLKTEIIFPFLLSLMYSMSSVLITAAIISLVLHYFADSIGQAFMPAGNITFIGHFYMTTHESGYFELSNKPSFLLETLYITLGLTLLIVVQVLERWFKKLDREECFQSFLNTPLHSIPFI